MSSLNILVMNWRDPRSPLAGGAEVRFVELFSRLVNKGHRVSLLCAAYPGSSPREHWQGFDIYHTGGEYAFQWQARQLYLSYLRGESFDIVVEMINKIPLETPRFVRHRLLAMVDHLFGDIAFLELPWPLACYVRFFESRMRRYYRDVPFVAVSQDTKEDLVKRGISASQVQLVYNGVSTDFYFPDPKIQKTEDPTVLYLGRLKRYKRIDLLLSAFFQVIKKIPRSKLVIAGRGSDLPRLQRMVEKLSLNTAVEFTGYVSEEEKRRLLRRAWVFVMPSLREGWGLVSLEAQACGTPALVADRPGIRETVQEGVSGFVIGGNFSSGLSERILSLLNDPGLLECLGKGAVAFSRRFQWDESAGKLMEIFGVG